MFGANIQLLSKIENLLTFYFRYFIWWKASIYIIENCIFARS